MPLPCKDSHFLFLQPTAPWPRPKTAAVRLPPDPIPAISTERLVLEASSGALVLAQSHKKLLATCSVIGAAVAALANPEEP